MKPQKRRIKNRTDYKKRMGLLKSGLPRISFRKTNKKIISQYIVSEEARDKIIFGFDSKILFKYGWPEEFKGSIKSTPASYLFGLFIGKNIIDKKLENPIIDGGMIRKTHKNKFFSFIKGLKDSGIKIDCDKEFFPPEERITGKHLKKDFSEIFKKIKLQIENGRKK